jgi:hypothetical protein
MKTFLRFVRAQSVASGSSGRACGNAAAARDRASFVRGSASLVALTLLLLGASGSSAFAGPENGTGTGGGGGTPSFSGGGGGGDETVGTLPSVNGDDVLDIRRFARIVRPSLYIQGHRDDVLAAAVAARGDRRVLVQPMPGNELRVVFLGDVQVGFDRNSFHVAALRVGVVAPESSPILRSGASWNGQDLPTWTYVYELPIAQFEANGLLDQAPILAGVATAQGVMRYRAHANVDMVVLTQGR